MIKQLNIENFKSFDQKTTFDLTRVNLFVGYNGRGKSSVIQSYLLLCQSLGRYGELDTLEVNGDYVELGLFEDLVSANCDANNPVSFLITTDQKEGHEVQLAYKENTEAERLGQVCVSRVDGVDYFFNTVKNLDTEQTSNIAPSANPFPNAAKDIFRNCNYVAADRKGPVLYEEKCDIHSNNPVGKNGENVLNNIAKHKKLKDKINFWIDYIMDGGNLFLEGNDRDSSVLSLNIGMPNSKRKNGFKAINCGFGYSYVLSIVVNALTMKKGTLVIENPEAHLHPQAQLRLTEMLSKELSDEVQLFIETHSEHIVNGFRIYALRPDVPMKTDDLSIYFFDEDYSIKHLNVERNGRIKNWPKGFFDQFEWEMTEIIRLGKQVQ